VNSELAAYPEYRWSGEEWIGQIPAHWSVQKLKFVSNSIVGGNTPASGNEAFWGGNITWITPQDISKTDRLRSSRRTLTEIGIAACSAVLVPPGSVVVTSRAPVGNVAVAEVELCTNQGCKAVVPDCRRINSHFLAALLESAKAELNSLARGTTFLEISTLVFENLKIPLPPLGEQQSIVR
jgi:type I restriction enzyme S subunit